MTFEFENLDEDTRKLMLEEVEMDLREDKLYLSNGLREQSGEIYESLLKEAVISGNEETFAKRIVENNCLKLLTPRNTKHGLVMAKMSKDAPLKLAEGEFNRFYIRGLCRVAISKTKPLEVYRAKQVARPRPESEALIDTTMNPEKLLKDLRENIGTGTSSGIPGGPNSGLSVRLVQVNERART